MDQRVLTAGCFVRCEGRWVFAVGSTASGDRLGIVRLGGHREKGETPWQCARREALEEASVQICHLLPPATYRIRGDLDAPDLEEMEWPLSGEAPMVVVERSPSGEGPVTLLYLAEAAGRPRPSAETLGLLFLTSKEIRHVVACNLTLQDFLNAGGEVALRPGFPTALPLEPFYHLRALGRLLALHPDLESPGALK